MLNNIISIKAEKRKKLLINKSALWYWQRKIREGKTIKVYKKTWVRVE